MSRSPHYLNVVISRDKNKDGSHKIILFDKTIRGDILGESLDAYVDNFIGKDSRINTLKQDNRLGINLDILKEIKLEKYKNSIYIVGSRPGLAYIHVNPKSLRKFYNRNEGYSVRVKNLFDRIIDFKVIYKMAQNSFVLVKKGVLRLFINTETFIYH